MAVPILTIPVDDSAFRKFMQAFKKYQDGLKDQPDIWNDVNKSVTDLVSISSDLANSIEKQSEATKSLADEEDKRDRKLQDASRRRKAENEDLRRRDEESARRRKEAIQQVKDYAAATGGHIGNLGAWAGGGGHIGELAQSASSGIGGASGAAGDILAGTAVGTIVSGIGAAIAGAVAGVGIAATAAYGSNKYAANMYRRAGGMGVTPGQLEFAENNQQRYYDVDQAIGSIASMQRRPHMWNTFGLLGLNPRNANTSNLTNEAVIRARRLFMKQGQNLDLAEQEGLTSFLSPDALIRLAGTPEAKLRASMKRGDDLSKYGITDKTGSASADFVAAMDNATSVIKDKLLNSLGSLDPALTKVTDDFTKLSTAMEKKNVSGENGPKSLIDNLQSPGESRLNAAEQAAANWVGDKAKGLYNMIFGKGEHGKMGQVSRAGALGKSQMLPYVAKDAARIAGVNWDENRFKTDEAYNTLLGQTWTKHLIDKYHNNALVAAAYNVGESVVDKWVKRPSMGDPRSGRISDLEWAKRIPFQGGKTQWETHDYVMRTLGHPELQNKPPKAAPQKKKASDFQPKKIAVNVYSTGGGLGTQGGRIMSA